MAWCQSETRDSDHHHGIVSVPNFALALSFWNTSALTTLMDVLPSPELSSDIQRALQQAVGQANNAFTSHQLIDQPKTAKRKRKDKEVKQKKKKVPTKAAQASPRESPSISAVRSRAQAKRGTKPNTQILGNFSESLISSSPSHSHSPESNFNAVVSAASTTNAHSESLYSTSQPCFDPQTSPSLPYELSLNSGAFQPPNSLSSTTADYASNDDILRVLQDLDVTKIANVLKTLGEAAAAANVPLASLPSTLLQRQNIAIPIDSTLSNPTVIAESSARRVLRHDGRVADTSMRQESLEPLDHARLLATKWLSANKLKELAKTQG